MAKARTAKQRAALRKAQLASARKRRRGAFSRAHEVCSYKNWEQNSASNSRIEETMINTHAEVANPQTVTHLGHGTKRSAVKGVPGLQGKLSTGKQSSTNLFGVRAR